MHNSTFFYSLAMGPISAVSLLSCGTYLAAQRAFTARHGKAFAGIRDGPFLLCASALSSLFMAVNWSLGLSLMVAKSDTVVVIFAATNLLQGTLFLPLLILAARSFFMRSKFSGEIRPSKVLEQSSGCQATVEVSHTIRSRPDWANPGFLNTSVIPMSDLYGTVSHENLKFCIIMECLRLHVHWMLYKHSVLW